VVRRGLDRERRMARGDEHRGRAAAAGRVRAREQPVRLLHPERPRATASRASRSTATTWRRCSRRRPRRASARGAAAGRP
jgi:hypothetical protein